MSQLKNSMVAYVVSYPPPLLLLKLSGIVTVEDKKGFKNFLAWDLHFI